MIPVDFDDSLYEDSVSGMDLANWCNKKYKPTQYDLSFDRNISEDDVWFIKRDFLPEFFAALPISSPNITVVTQHSDYELDDAVMSLKPNCIKQIFSPNNTHDSICSIPIPLGLGPSFVENNIAPSVNDIKKKNTRQNREKLLYVNFRPYTYPQERMPLVNALKASQYDWVTIDSCDDDVKKEKYMSLAKDEYLATRKDDYVNGLISHKFSLCPRGNGIDTHRIWESLYCRTIPIVRYENAHRNFRDLPILFIDDWSVLSEEYLDMEYERMTRTVWNYSKLSASWWGKKFKETLGVIND
jgi:hypothetical protein